MIHSTFSQFCRALAITAAISCAAYAQPPGGGGFGGFGGGGLVGLVSREEVQQEIQLVDEQRDKVMEISEAARDKMRDEMRSMFSEMRDLSGEERRERFGEIRSKMEEMNADVESQLKKALLPHQLERLKQIDLQQRMQSRGEGGLSSRAVSEALDLTDEEREKLEKKAEEVRAELQAKIREAQAEAREKILEALPAEKKAKLEEMLGDTFQMNEEDRFGRGGFRGRDGRGERDGERGRDGGRERRGNAEAI